MPLKRQEQREKDRAIRQQRLEDARKQIYGQPGSPARVGGTDNMVATALMVFTDSLDEISETMEDIDDSATHLESRLWWLNVAIFATGAVMAIAAGFQIADYILDWRRDASPPAIVAPESVEQPSPR